MSHLSLCQLSPHLLELEAVCDLMEDLNVSEVPGWAETGTPVTSPTLVYRIEFPNGRGPFNCSTDERLQHSVYAHLEALGCVTNATLCGEKCGISDAAFREAHGHADYGCSSLDGLRSWFPDEARAFLAQYDCAVKVYEVPVGDSILSLPNGDEVVFNLHSAKVTTVLDITTLAAQLEQAA